ncbi:hypothetical protein NE236_29790 [Actinoallomurus purpureus]|uniref:hypothetical protein n=1 Tax=Actinoallomurus purpureus TaxID=478114 RepID=UPI002092F1CF|nr:hypothetical protein [Actinoallomurus purpureus]MCO6009169.1 hypothetical protein [Actinoallomurus purpureus]
MNDEGAASRPRAADDSWIIIDDTREAADEPPATPEAADEQPATPEAADEQPATWAGSGFDALSGPVPSEKPAVTPPSASSGPPQSHGWDSFAGAETWNGMQVAPPGTTLGSASAVDGGVPADRQTAGTTGPSPSTSGWGVRASDTGQDRSKQTVENTWFLSDGEEDDADDGEGADGTAPTAWIDRLPRVDGPVLSARLITFTVICLSALLLFSSIIWHPHAP